MSTSKTDNPFKGSMNFFRNFKVPGINLEAAAANHHKNLEILSQAQQTGAEAFKAMVGLNSSYLKKTFEEATGHARNLASAEGVSEKTKKQMDFLNTHVGNTLEHGKELSSTIAQSTNKFFDICSKRFQESLAEGQEILKPSTAASAKPGNQSRSTSTNS